MESPPIQLLTKKVKQEKAKTRRKKGRMLQKKMERTLLRMKEKMAKKLIHRRVQIRKKREMSRIRL